MQKVLVVDNGQRALDSALSAELAGMGLASVTAPVEAASDVLALLQNPAAVVLQMPPNASWCERRRFQDLAEHARAEGLPVVMLGASDGSQASLLQSKLGARILSQPER